jgi:hypothetical protein
MYYDYIIIIIIIIITAYEEESPWCTVSYSSLPRF